MIPAYLDAVSFRLPCDDPAASSWFDAFSSLLAQLPNATVEQDQISLTPQAPPTAVPQTIFRRVAGEPVQMVFATEQLIDLPIARLHVRSTQVAPSARAGRQGLPASGEGLLLDELVEGLDGHLVRIDHTGLNLPTTLVTPESWTRLLRSLAPACGLYRYPTGEEWPFIVPATAEELRDGITQFVAGREPKFELVYDSWAHQPVIQVSVETDLARPELEDLFPAPHGVSFPDLGDIFRTVYVAHPWPDLTIRFDLYYHSSGEPDAWTTGEWLVTQGGRIASLPPARTSTH